MRQWIILTFSDESHKPSMPRQLGAMAFFLIALPLSYAGLGVDKEYLSFIVQIVTAAFTFAAGCFGFAQYKSRGVLAARETAKASPTPTPTTTTPTPSTKDKPDESDPNH